MQKRELLQSEGDKDEVEVSARRREALAESVCKKEKIEVEIPVQR